MRLPTTLFLILALFALALANAIPGGGPPPAASKSKFPPYNELATWNCTHTREFFYSHFSLRGRDWNKTEKEIKKVVADAGIITAWKYSAFEEYGRPTFESSFNLPWGRSKSLGETTSRLLGINKRLKNPKTGQKWIGVECPRIPRE